MIKKGLVLVFLFSCFFVFCGETKLLTVAESSNYLSTSRYADVNNFFKKLKEKYPRNLQIKEIGTTFEGYKIKLILLGDSANITAENNKKPVILINANIHAGEVEGKEVVQMLARDILTNNRKELLDKLTILIIPIFNVDGNEKISPKNRSYQKVKNGVGVRTNGMNMDINRDFIKLESPEGQTLVKTFNKWKPIVFVDCHTTDGSYHVEELTFAWGNHPNGSIEIGNDIYKNFFPFMKKFAFENHKIQTLPYGNYDDPFNPKKWQFFAANVVYASSYFGIKGAYSFLDENYARADYKARIRACYAFLDGVLTYSYNNSDAMVKNVNNFRNETKVHYYYDLKDKAYPEKLTIKGYKVKRSETGWYKSTGIREDYTVDFMGDFQGKHEILNCEYIFPIGLKPIVDKLRQHGIIVNQLKEEKKVMAKHYKIDSVKYATAPFQGHIMIKELKGKYIEEEVTFKKGWYVVRLGKEQIYRQLVPVLLEPESVDSLLSYGYFNTLIYPNQWRKKIGYYPVYRVDIK